MIPARWIRLEAGSPAALRAAVAAFAGAQPARAAPTVLWARIDDENSFYALAVPRKFAPGRKQRWPAWALAPLVAAYRVFGWRAYLEAGTVCVGGVTVASCEASAVGECAVVLGHCLPADDTQFMVAIRHCIAARQDWEFDTSWPTEAERVAIEDALTLEASGAAP